jgi:hypothetical protein
MRFRPALPVLLTASALAACSQQAEDQTATAPTPTPTLTTQAVPTQAADGTPLTVGQWLVEENAVGASATFREQSGTNALVLACNRTDRSLSLSLSGAAGQPQRYRITVGAQKADVMLAPGGAAGLTALVDGRQPIFATFADPAAVLEFTGPGMTPLRLPGNPGISRVFAACG